MKRAKRTDGFVTIRMGAKTYSSEIRWNHDGSAESRQADGEIAKDQPWEPRPDLAYGTPMGDLLIDPWIQDALKTEER